MQAAKNEKGCSVVSLTAQALHNVPGFLPPIQEALSMASPTDRYINLLLLNYRAQQVR